MVNFNKNQAILNSLNTRPRYFLLLNFINIFHICLTQLLPEPLATIYFALNKWFKISEKRTSNSNDNSYHSSNHFVFFFFFSCRFHWISWYFLSSVSSKTQGIYFFLNVVAQRRIFTLSTFPHLISLMLSVWLFFFLVFSQYVQKEINNTGTFSKF